MYFLRWLITAGINPVTLRRMKGFLIKYIKLCEDPDCYTAGEIKKIFPPLSSTKTYYMSQS